MIAMTSQSKIFVCRKPVDFRFGFDRLAHLCKSLAGRDPFSGNFFVFFNRSFTRAKVIFYDGRCSCMLWKRIEKGRFRGLASSEAGFESLRRSEVLLLLGGSGVDGWKPTEM